MTRGTCGTADRRIPRPTSSIRSGIVAAVLRDHGANGRTQDERIFEPPGGFYAARYKHLVEPEASWNYRKSDDKFDLVNRFDRYDSSAQDNQISLGLVNRLLAKRYRDGVEESSATDVITWRIQQTWYFDPTSGSYDSSYVRPRLRTVKWRCGSPRSARTSASLRDQSVNGDWTMEWDPDERLFTSIRAGVRVGGRLSNRRFNFNWSRRARRIGGEDSEEVSVKSYLRAGTDFFPTEVIRTGLDVNYDISERRLSNIRLRADFLLQCCGLNVEWIRYTYEPEREHLPLFGITLGGITSFGFGDRRRERPLLLRNPPSIGETSPNELLGE